MSNQTPETSNSYSLKMTLTVFAIVLASSAVTAAINWVWAGGGADAARGQILIQTLAVGVGFSVVGLILARQFSKPIVDLKTSLEAVVNGQSTPSAFESTRQDEIGAITRSIAALQAAAEKDAQSVAARETCISALSEALTKLKQGELTYRIAEAFPDAYRTIQVNYNETMDALEDILGSVSSHAALIRTNARDIGQTSDQLSQRTENQAATLEESSAAIEEMATSVASTAEGAKQADQLVGSAKSSAEASGMVMDQAVEAMKQIETSSARISQVVSVIDDIAFQTNLLALNASVEAARAGDAGRGFAVVASEVRALAQRSSDAAKEIETLMAESESHVSHGVEHVHKAVDTLRSIASSVTDISGAVSSIASTAQEQSLGVSEINSAISNLDQATQQTAVMVSESARAGAALSQQADELEQFVRAFGGPVQAPKPAPVKAAPIETAPVPVEAMATEPAPVPSPVADQQEKLARYVASEGSAALKMDEPEDSDWIEF